MRCQSRQEFAPNTPMSERRDHVAADRVTNCARRQDYRSPKNYDGGGDGILTLRQAFEKSRNLRLLVFLKAGRSKA
jgi:membrane peptidoglycan carboxypeptidase